MYQNNAIFLVDRLLISLSVSWALFQTRNHYAITIMFIDLQILLS